MIKIGLKWVNGEVNAHKTVEKMTINISCIQKGFGFVIYLIIILRQKMIQLQKL